MVWRESKDKETEDGGIEGSTGRTSEIDKIASLEEYRDLKEAGRRRRQVIMTEVREKRI